MTEAVQGLQQTATGAADQVGGAAQGAAGAAGQTAQGATGAAGQASDTAQGAAGQAGDTAKGAAGQASDTAQGTAGQAGDTAQGAAGQAGETAQGGSEKADGELSQQDKELALRLSQIIENANDKLGPHCNMIRRHIETFMNAKEDDRDEGELVKQVKPLLQQSENLMHETNGSIKGADPDNRLSNQAKRNAADHKASPEEQRLAEALKTLVQDVGGTIEWAKDKLEGFPKAKKDLGPLLDALGAPLTQIVGGVGLLLGGVLNLVDQLLSGLGLNNLLKGIVGATGLDKIYKGLGLDKWLQGK